MAVRFLLPEPLYGSIYGSLYFALIMTSSFYGVTCMQTFFYYIHYQGDSMRVKIFVAITWVWNTIHAALAIAGAYKYIMAGLLDPLSMLTGPPELVLQLVFTSLVAVATQSFFVYRIYVFTGKNIVGPVVFVPLAVYQLVSTLIYVTNALYSNNGSGVQVVPLPTLGDDFFVSIATSSLSVAAAVDIVIALCLTFLLVRKRTSAEFSNTIHVLRRLTAFAVNAGIWTATFALLSLILLHVYPSNLLYAVFGFPLCSVYCNTLLANLNARAYIRGESTTHNVDVDLFASSTSRATDSTCQLKSDKRHRSVSFRTSATAVHVDGHGGVPIMVGNRISPSTSETAWA